MPGDPRIWGDRSRKGHESDTSTEGWGNYALCSGDDRFVDRSIPEAVVQELIDICHRCPVMERCAAWADAQTQPVGFVVAAGKRWKAWNHCAICGKKVRGIDRCAQHQGMADPTGTIEPDGTGRDYRVTDEH